MIAVDLQTGDIPQVFADFRELIGERHWQNRAAAIKGEIRGNVFLREYLVAENSIALQLDHCSELVRRYGVIPFNETQNREIYPALSFAAQALSIVAHSTSEQAKQMVGRLRGALKNPDEMRAIRLELVAATHFVRRRRSISWPEMDGSGNFDLFVHEIGGGDGLEVECKSIGNDKGRKIHRREALEFNTLLSRDLQPLTRNLTSGLVVVMTIPGRLPSLTRPREELAKRVITTILAGRSATFDDGVDIRVSDFDMQTLTSWDASGRPVIARETLDELTLTKNREVMVLGRRNSGAVVFVLQSMDDDKFMDSIFSTLSQSAKTQVTGARPALYLAGFNEIGMEALIDVAKQDLNAEQAPSALRIAVSKFLRSDERDHVVGVGFLSSSSLIPRTGGNIESGGSAYMFPRRESKLWHEDFSGLFSRS